MLPRLRICTSGSHCTARRARALAHKKGVHATHLRDTNLLVNFLVAELQLYVKTWCPWCIRAKAFLDAEGYRYQEIDVEANREDYAEMIQLSGQRLTPTLVVGDKVLPDFGPEELRDFLAQNCIVP